MKNEDLCPCKSGKTFGECCGPILSGEKNAETAESVMRARYSAYVVREIDYLKKSSVKSLQEDFNAEEMESWSTSATWHGLEVLRTENGGPGDDTGVVEFRALYSARGEFCNHHEISNFVREDGEWRFADGELVKEQQVRRETPKIGRNDPCPCGSGKKYKKCCGKGS